MTTPQTLPWGRWVQVQAEPASSEHLLDGTSSISPWGVPCTCLRVPSFPQMHWRVYEGIPPHVRGETWSLLLEKVKADNQGKYQVWLLHLCLWEPSPVPSFPSSSQAHLPRKPCHAHLLAPCSLGPVQTLGPELHRCHLTLQLDLPDT